MSAHRPNGGAVTLPKLAFGIDEAVVASGLSRSFLYEAIRDKRLSATKAGARTLLLEENLRAFLGALPTK